MGGGMLASILVIDQGTTSTRAIIFDAQGKILSQAQQEITQYFPHSAWVEHDAEQIWSLTIKVCREALQAVDKNKVMTIGITNQRETTVLWDRKTGEVIHPAIVWQDRRTTALCEDMEKQYGKDFFSDKTGLVLDPYFSASKIHWLLTHVDGAREKARSGTLAFGTIDSFLLWRLTGGRVHATDASNAARTLLFNIKDQTWDDDLCAAFDIPTNILPSVLDNATYFGETDPSILGKAYPITAMVGDQQSALVGQCCFQKGMVKSTYGTGCFLVMNTGEHCFHSQDILSTVAYRLKGKVTYAIEGSIFSAGTSVQWLRDSMRLIDDAKETEGLAKTIDDNAGVYLVPAFTGMGAPYWDPHARAAILGLTRDTGVAHIARAALEAVCYQTRDLLGIMQKESGSKINQLRVDGGMVTNNWLLQFLADMVQVCVARPFITETTAAGAAYFAGLGIGLYDSLETISQLWQVEKTFVPLLSQEKVDIYYRGWQAAANKICQQM